MNSLASGAAPTTSPPPSDSLSDSATDYCARALVLWPRLERGRLARVRHDPIRVAALVSRRTTLSYAAILELLGVSSEESDVTTRDH
jgi:hypothetical protein